MMFEDTELSSEIIAEEEIAEEIAEEAVEAIESEIEAIEEALDETVETETAEEAAEAHAEEPKVSEEELDRIADTAIASLQGLLKYFNVGEITIDEYEGDEGELIFDITGEDLAILIGRHGKTLDALQLIVSSITARTIGFRYPVVIDVEGYKSRQRQKLESLAHSAANRAVTQKHNVKLRPMTPYERRIVHIALRDDPRVETASEGEGSARHVVVFPQQ